MTNQSRFGAGNSERLDEQAVEHSELAPAAHLRQLLAQANLGQRAAARALGVDERSMRYWCTGQSAAPQVVMLALQRLIQSQRIARDAALGPIPQAEAIAAQIGTIGAQLHDGGDVATLRRDVVNLIDKVLSAMRDRLGYWEIEQLGLAIAAVGWNIHSHNEKSNAWLAFALTCAAKAIVPVDERNEACTPQDPKIAALSVEDLAEALSQVRATLP